MSIIPVDNLNVDEFPLFSTHEEDATENHCSIKRGRRRPPAKSVRRSRRKQPKKLDIKKSKENSGKRRMGRPSVKPTKYDPSKFKNTIKRNRGRPPNYPIKLKMSKEKRRSCRGKEEIPFNYRCGHCERRERYPCDIINHNHNDHAGLDLHMMYWDEDCKQWKCCEKVDDFLNDAPLVEQTEENQQDVQ
ncbi:uncharacterized protein LOC131666892 [Phymastichus coffea]|uniref:uncharacterized protein LOC131666892 n=1 Tax=Phymastichus coffea TaxID=108790 RepID=UPI00273BC91C|nr:uncharacterized protein LOC131666892 [Phymastichus coffea]